ncbi:hypothetical protein DVH24_009782 [Malus domestica]|uniref:Uncharacterized protein n=1 Tax=Malus domestica TaxID=3750 RepID=A0A498KKP3_MALDO|nr:hypothetical protein DVH24_009782 [Malus domestica]
MDDNAFRETQGEVKPPGVWGTLNRVFDPVKNKTPPSKLYVNSLLLVLIYFSTVPPVMIQNYRLLWTTLGTQLTCDVPFSAI